MVPALEFYSISWAVLKNTTVYTVPPNPLTQSSPSWRAEPNELLPPRDFLCPTALESTGLRSLSTFNGSCSRECISSLLKVQDEGHFFLLQLERKFKSPAFFEKPSEEASDGTAAGCTAHCVPYLPAVLSPADCCPAHVCSAWSSFSTGKSLPLEVLRSCRNRNGPWMWAIYLEGRTFSPSPLTLLGTDIFILTVIPYELKDRWDGYYWQWSNWVRRAGSITHPWGV